MNKRKAEDDKDETQKPNKQAKPIHPLFLKHPPSDAAFTWIKTASRTFHHGTHLTPRQSSKVAAFDLDGVLITPKSGGTYPKDRNDWMWWRPVVKDKLSELYKEGYTIVIFSNQATTRPKTIDEWRNKIPLVAKELPNTPFRIFAAQAYDWYRKPMPGMWLEFEKINEVPIDFSASFFVGDAAGRPGDHSDTDRKLALNTGLPFFTPEEFFLNKPPTPYKLTGFDIKEWPTDQTLFVPTSTPLIPAPVLGNPPLTEVVLFVGYPASGKTTFYRRYFEPKGYKHVNQDILKTRPKCLKTVEECLKAGEPCVVDNTNRDIETRKQYIDICKKYNVPIRCIYFVAPLELCWHNNLYRIYSKLLESYVTTSSTTVQELNAVSENVSVATSETTIVKKGKTKTTITKATTTTTKTTQPPEPLPPLAFISYRANFEEPMVEEGFAEVKRVNFIYEDSDGEPDYPPVNEGEKSESTTTDRSKFWTKRRLWKMWLEIGKLGWMSQSLKN